MNQEFQDCDIFHAQPTLSQVLPSVLLTESGCMCEVAAGCETSALPAIGSQYNISGEINQHDESNILILYFRLTNFI